MFWCVIPAAGSSRRFGGDVPKQYCQLGGRPMLVATLERLATHPAIAGFVVSLADQDRWWPGLAACEGKPIVTCVGGVERADSVLAGLKALPGDVGPRDWVLVHDAARPCVSHADLTRLIERGRHHPVGAILATPVRDTLKRSGNDDQIEATVPRENLWRAQTPQMFRRGELMAALESARRLGRFCTDDANALELSGKNPLLVEGSDENLKVTSSADMALAEAMLAGRLKSVP